MKQMAKIILMKVTSRERPEVLLETIKSYVDNAINLDDMKWLFSFDENDKSYDENFISKLSSIINYYSNEQINFVIGKSLNKIDAINRDISMFDLNWDILLNISDDQRAVVKGYDDFIRHVMPNHLDASLWFNDGHQDRINTQEIVGREYYKRFNYIYNPGYKSFFCDNEATDVALKIKKIIKSKDTIIKHFHPQWEKNGPIKIDNLYKSNEINWKHDEAFYNKRKQEGYK